MDVASVQEDYCERHIGMPVTMACSQCGKKICRECIQEFGYFCGPECLEESRANISEEDVEQREQEELELEEMSRKTFRIIGIAAGVVALLVAWWVWASFIAAPGKPAWTWQPESSSRMMEIVSVDGKYVNVIAGQRLYRIKASNGKEKKSLDLGAQPGGAFVKIKTLPDKLYAVSPTRAFAIDFKTEKVVEMAFAKPGHGAVFSADGQTVFLLHPQSYNYLKKTVDTPAQISCYSFPDSTPKWEIYAEDGYRFSHIAYVEGALVVVEETGSLYDENSTCRLSVHDSATGQRKWRLTFEESLIWGPAAKAGCVAIHAGGTFVVVGIDGSQKWAVAVPKTEMVAHVLTDTHAFVQKETGEECRDLFTGKRQWRCSSIFDGGFLVEKGGRLLASGYTSRVETGSSPLMPGGEGMNEIMEDISGGTGGMLAGLMSQPVLTALDKDSGKRAWRRENLSGNFFGDGTRIVEVSGVGSVNLVQLFSGGGGGGTMIRQFSPKDGETLYTRSLEFSLDAHSAIGDRLVGVAYDMPKKHDSLVLVGLRLK